VNFKDTLKDINYKEATTVTKASYNTIAALVYHTRFYNEVVLKRLQGISPAINEKNGFDLPPIKNEDDWKRLIQRCFQSAHDLAEAVKKIPEEKLSELTKLISTKSNVKEIARLKLDMLGEYYDDWRHALEKGRKINVDEEFWSGYDWLLHFLEQRK